MIWLFMSSAYRVHAFLAIHGWLVEGRHNFWLCLICTFSILFSRSRCTPILFFSSSMASTPLHHLVEAWQAVGADTSLYFSGYWRWNVRDGCSFVTVRVGHVRSFKGKSMPVPPFCTILLSSHLGSWQKGSTIVRLYIMHEYRMKRVSSQAFEWRDCACFLESCWMFI